MNWSDEGFLISKTRYNENSLIAELFTKDKGKISGIIFGGTCLLYTSPSPRDLSTSRMPSSA